MKVIILSHIWGAIDEVWIGYWIYWHHSGTTSNHSVTADLHALQVTTATAKPFPACCVSTSRSLTTASYSGDSSVSRAQVLLSQPSCITFVNSLPTANY
jgi:hypothetical protein